MQDLARETNLSETTFILPRDAAARKRPRSAGPHLHCSGRTAVCRTSHARHGVCLARHRRRRGLKSGSHLNVGIVPVASRTRPRSDAFGEMTQKDPEFGSDPQVRTKSPLSRTSKLRISTLRAHPDRLDWDALHDGDGAVAEGDERLRLDLDRAGESWRKRAESLFTLFAARPSIQKLVCTRA